MARVTPLYKGGSKTERDNQRPISVLPCVSKVQESFANADLRRYALETGLINDRQFAYGKHSSTTVALIITVDAWKFAIDKGKKVVCAFLDLRKAFDVCNIFNLGILRYVNYSSYNELCKYACIGYKGLCCYSIKLSSLSDREYYIGDKDKNLRRSLWLRTAE